MYTGDVHLDTMYSYFPSLLSEDDLFKAVKSRFPKLPNLNDMNKEELLEFYLKHIFPRPQRKYPRDSEGMALQEFRNREQKECKEEEEEKTWLYPPQTPKFRLKRFGHRFSHDSLEAGSDKKIKLQAEQIIKASKKSSSDGVKPTEIKASSRDPRPSTSTRVDLKRSFLQEGKEEGEPARKQRLEIKWP